MTITAPDGAYIIGGGEYHFGQAVTEDLARAAFEFPMPNLGNMVELLRSVLELLPLDVLKPFKDFLGLDDAHFGTVIDAVNNIISSLQQRPIFMLLTDFTSWVKDLVQAITGVAGGDLSMLTTWFKSNVVDQIAGVVKVIQDLIDGLFSLFGVGGATNKTPLEVITAIGNWLSGVFQPVADGLAGVVKMIQDLLDGLFGLFGISGVTGKTPLEVVAAIGTWLSGVFQPVSDGLTTIVKTVTDLIEGFFNLFGGSGTASLAGMLSFATNWMTVTFKGVSDGLATIVKMVQDLFDGIWRLFTGNATGVGKDLTATLAAISGWLTGVFKPVADGLTAIVKIVQDLLDGLFGLFGVSGATGKTPLEVITAIGTWLTGVFQPISDGLTAIVKTVTDLIDGFFKLFGGTGTVSLAGMITAATSWMTHWQEFVDGIWTAFSGGVAGVNKTVADAVAALKGWFGNFHKLLDALFGAFGGVAGTDKTITDVIGAITGWFTNVFQKLIDGVNALASLIPGFSTASNPIQNVVNIISGILGIGQSAASAAATANIKILALEAAQKNGFHDEFDYPKANVLPAPWTNTGNKLWGPSGKGILEYLGPNGIGGGGQQVYKQPTNPIVGATGTISVGLWKPPHHDFAVQSHVGINAMVSLGVSDSSCLQWWIDEDRAELRVLDAAGNATRQGTLQVIPRLAAGDTLEMSWTATESKLKVNDIVQATRPWTGTLAGQNIGLTLQTGAYTWLGSSNHPAPEISGIAWHP